MIAFETCKILVYWIRIVPLDGSSHRMPSSSFSSFTSQSNWQVFYPPCSCTLEFSTETTAAAIGDSYTRHCYWFFSSVLALSSHQFHSKLKTFLIEQSFPPQSCLHQLLSVLWPLDLPNGFRLTVIFTRRLFSPRSCTPVSVNQL